MILEGDSLLVVNVINDPSPNWLRYGHLINDIKTILESFSRWSSRRVKREVNSTAHGLAKNAIRNSVFQTRLKEPPSCIFYVVTLEQLALFL